MKITDYQIEGIDSQDYPDFCDAYLSYAEDENGKELNEEQLLDWQEQNEIEFYDMVLQSWL
tara:strand:+ start:1161 stop:1343 length:183 start_codon:yes stop_codon:yes gene_type:complete